MLSRVRWLVPTADTVGIIDDHTHSGERSDWDEPETQVGAGDGIREMVLERDWGNYRNKTASPSNLPRSQNCSHHLFHVPEDAKYLDNSGNFSSCTV
ncbi:hypothetical protein J6590_000776 [Homalodisca vitripennis]|nr:hypothetical protein J6590_000776 [Homalodisca vitripennis]